MKTPDQPDEQGGGAGRVRRLLQPPRSKRGVLMLLAVVAGIGSVVTVVGLSASEWTETAGFCSRCHTMTPEVKANKLSPHRDVTCGECHLEPGIGGWIKAKASGAKRASEMITGSYPKPIPPPDRAKLPSVKDTCMKCHALDAITKEGRPSKIILRPRYRKDRWSTKEMVAVVVRRKSGEQTEGRGAHWHVQKQVEFASPDEQSQKIDWIRITEKNGKPKQFVARSKVGISSDVRQDIRQLKRVDTTRPMDCISCHNRVGHDIPSPDREIDKAIAAGKISRDLPYIKREGLSRVSARYSSTEAADRAITDIRKTYAARYPLVLKTHRRSVSKAIDELKLIYGLVATPEMKVTAKTYPNNLGHQRGPGCFRCHDGAHFQVVKGQVTKRTIPSKCSTCHTFPQVGSKVSSVPLVGEPAFHEAKANILFSHPAAVVRSGRGKCSSCHQPVFCAQCHKNSGARPTTTRVERRRGRLHNRDRE